ncbi:putative cysteine proteases [Pseudomonas aeruginosa]|nr:putative cysteine proteases [Pseudomonas aeruginosa]
MPRHPFSPSFLAASVFCAATPALAALQPIAEAPLAGETEFRCQFNADNSTDCVSTYSFTILKPSGREMLSRIDRSYAETDSLIVEKAELTQPGGKPVPLDQSQIDTRTAPNPDQGFLRERQTSLAFPNLRVGTRISYTLREHFTAKPLSTQFHYILSRPPMPVRDDRFVAEFKAERPIFVRSELMDAYRIEQSADKKTLQGQPEKAAIHQLHQRSRQRLPAPYPAPGAGQFAGPAGQLRPVRRALQRDPRRGAAQGRHGGRRRGEGQAGPRAGRRPDAVHQRHLPLPGRLARQRARLRALLPGGDRAQWLRRLQGPGDPPRRHAQGRRDQGRTDPGQPRRRGLGPAGARHVRAEPCHRPRRGGRQTWWLDPTNPVFAPGRTMPDIQQRWALVLGADGKVRRDEIPLEAPGDTLRVTRSEHYTP